MKKRITFAIDFDTANDFINYCKSNQLYQGQIIEKMIKNFLNEVNNEN